MLTFFSFTHSLSFCNPGLRWANILFCCRGKHVKFLGLILLHLKTKYQTLNENKTCIQVNMRRVWCNWCYPHTSLCIEHPHILMNVQLSKSQSSKCLFKPTGRSLEQIRGPFNNKWFDRCGGKTSTGWWIWAATRILIKNLKCEILAALTIICCLTRARLQERNQCR